MKNEIKQQEQQNISGERKYQKTSLIADAWKRLKRNKLAVVGMIILLIFIIMAIFAPVIAPYDPIEIHWGDEALAPFWMQTASQDTAVDGKNTVEPAGESSADQEQEWDTGDENSSSQSDSDWSTGDTESNSNSQEESGWSSGSDSSADESNEGSWNAQDSGSNDSEWNTSNSGKVEGESSNEGGWTSGSESSTSDEVFQGKAADEGKKSVASEKPDNFYLLGTDQMGRDLLSRIIYGARLTLIVGLVSVSISLVIGTVLGLLSGFFGGIVDTIIMRFMDILLSFPYILLAIFIVSILGRGLTNAMIAIGVVGTPRFARVVRSQVLTVKEQEYVMASRTLGANNMWLITKHIFVNSLSPLIVQTTMSLASAILYAAALGFLGLGAQAPTPEWGVMLSDARSAMLTAPWVITFPGIAIILCVLGFNLLGDGLRDSLDPRQKR